MSDQFKTSAEWNSERAGYLALLYDLDQALASAGPVEAPEDDAPADDAEAPRRLPRKPLILRPGRLRLDDIKRILGDAVLCSNKVRVRTITGGRCKGWVMEWQGDVLEVGGYLHKASKIDWSMVRWVEVIGYLPKREYSDDGNPFFDGCLWRRSGDVILEDGKCEKCGKPWGASVKIITCTCGADVYLT